MNLVGRNGASIPTNMEVDAKQRVVTSATFANAQFFLEARPWQRAGRLTGVSTPACAGSSTNPCARSRVEQEPQLVLP